MDTHLDQLHDQVEFAVSVHFLDEQNNVWMLDPPEDGHLVLDHVLLEIRIEIDLSQVNQTC